MARWRLTAPHYLNVPGTTWEYKETDRTTGKPMKKVFAVPTLLDPANPGDWTLKHGPDEGEVIVCYADKGEARDIVFEGEPTPDMMPLDDEARTISESFAGKWKHPIDTLPNSYADTLVEKFQKDIADVRSKTASTEGIGDLLAAMTAMMKQNQEILTALTATKTESARRV